MHATIITKMIPTHVYNITLDDEDLDALIAVLSKREEDSLDESMSRELISIHLIRKELEAIKKKKQEFDEQLANNPIQQPYFEAPVGVTSTAFKQHGCTGNSYREAQQRD